MLGVAREWVSRLENRRGEFSEPIKHRIVQLENEALSHEHMRHRLMVEEPPEMLPVVPTVRELMLTATAPGPPLEVRSTEQQAELRELAAKLLSEALHSAGDDLARIGWIVEQLRTHLRPPAHWRTGGPPTEQWRAEMKREVAALADESRARALAEREGRERQGTG